MTMTPNRRIVVQMAVSEGNVALAGALIKDVLAGDVRRTTRYTIPGRPSFLVRVPDGPEDGPYMIEEEWN